MTASQTDLDGVEDLDDFAMPERHGAEDVGGVAGVMISTHMLELSRVLAHAKLHAISRSHERGCAVSLCQCLLN